MSAESERAKCVISLLDAARNILTQAENEGHNAPKLLKATSTAKLAIDREMDRQLALYDASRGSL